ncbi:hypothetical protein [Aeromonas finlandensis]|uniref:hypothetical protein n=1 Tax=Aeromonas finlandensis TaxID=1543375 RepID=UPI00051ADB3F|nr:hypothetical protein [Aeromonas finlandensis]
MDSKWKWPALKVARWAFKHGEFFDLYDVSYLLGIPASDAGKVVLYLRSLRYVEKEAETRRCKPEPGRMACRRVFIKVLAIYPEPTNAQAPVLDEIRCS